MIFALGFLVAALLSLLFLPAVQRRAARLSARRLQMQLPLSMEEIVAERDQLRAEFAVERRRMEQKLEAAAIAEADHMGEIGRRATAMLALETQLTETREELRALRQAKETLQGEMAAAQATLAALQKAHEEETAAHTGTRESLEALKGEHSGLEQVSYEQRASVAGLETRAAALDLRIVALTHQKEDLEKNLQAKTAEAEVLQVERDLARAERESIETKRATLQRRLDEEAMQVADLRDQIEAFRRRAEEAERIRVGAEQAREAATQRHDQLSRRLEEREARARTAESAAAERHERQRAEIATLTGALESTRGEITRLQQERRAQRQDVKAAGNSSGAEPKHPPAEETALVRQAIADLGADVLKIAEELKNSRSKAEAREPIPPDVMGLSQPRSRAGAQP